MADEVFWRRKTLQEMTVGEWEALCDGCGKCCLHKLEDEDNGDVYYTRIACRYLDHDTCHCTAYPRRQALVANCVVLTPDTVASAYWLPETCAYRLINEGIPLFDWHPLVSGDPDTVHRAGVSVAGKVLDEASVPEDEYEEHIIRWI